MATAYAFAGQKGGAGKSTMAIAVAAELMARGSKVLLVDADPQGTATTWTEVSAEAGHATPTLVAMGANMHRPGQLDEVAKLLDVVVVDCPPRHGEVMRAAFALEKMRYDKKSGMVIYRFRLHATLKRNYQLMPALKWLRMLMNHIPDKYEHLVRYRGHYSNRSRGARRLVENGNEPAGPIRIDRPPADNRRKTNWARLTQKANAVGPLECVSCGGSMRIIALIDDAGVIERLLRHLDQWDTQPDTPTRWPRSALARRPDHSPQLSPGTG